MWGYARHQHFDRPETGAGLKLDKAKAALAGFRHPHSFEPQGNPMPLSQAIPVGGNQLVDSALLVERERDDLLGRERSGEVQGLAADSAQRILRRVQGLGKFVGPRASIAIVQGLPVSPEVLKAGKIGVGRYRLEVEPACPLGLITIMATHLRFSLGHARSSPPRV